jgi:hypothetical protein
MNEWTGSAALPLLRRRLLPRWCLWLRGRSGKGGREASQPLAGPPRIRVHAAEHQGYVRLQSWIVQGGRERLDAADLLSGESEAVLLDMAAQFDRGGGTEPLRPGLVQYHVRQLALGCATR